MPPAREPESAVNRPALGSAPVTRVAAPRLREDAATAQTTVRLTPLFRPHRHPSRLPVFHTTVEKAHMPSGAFRGYGLGQVIFAADDMGDAHFQIINDIDQMKHGLAVRPHDDKVGLDFFAIG